MSEHEFQVTPMFSGRCEFCNRPADEHDGVVDWGSPEKESIVMGWLNESPKVTMSDNLRDRIAKVLLGDQPYTGPENAAAHIMADVLIEDLSLMIDDSYRISNGNAFIVHGYYEVRETDV